jgi:histone H4
MAYPHKNNMLGFFRSMTSATAVLGPPVIVPSAEEGPSNITNPAAAVRNLLVTQTQTQDQAPVVQAPAPVVQAPIVQAPAPIVQAPVVQAPIVPVVQAPIAPVVQAPRRFAPGAFGRGKGAKGIGKGGHKRHRKVLRDNIQGVTNGAIRRLARRGGVKRLSGLVYEETRNVLVDFVRKVVHDACEYADYAKRKTIVAMDVVFALKRQGRPIYGFGG